MTKEVLHKAFKGQCRGDQDSRELLLAILDSHDRPVWQNIFSYVLPPPQHRLTVLWLLPLRARMMIMRTRTIQQAARLSADPSHQGDLMQALEAQWVLVYWRIVQYHD